MTCLATSLLIVSIPVTTNAKVTDPLKLEGVPTALKLAGLEPSDWLLIELKTLKALDKDAQGYQSALEKLVEAQEQHTKDTDRINLLQMEKHQLSRQLYEKEVRIYELENPTWYQHPAFWGSVGVAAGIVVTVVGLAAGGIIGG